MSLTDLVSQMDTIIHKDVDTVKTHAQGIIQTVEASHASAAAILNDMVIVLNGLNDVAPRAFILHPELGVLVSELRAITGPGTTVDVGVLYTALKSFLTPPVQDIPTTVEATVVTPATE